MLTEHVAPGNRDGPADAVGRERSTEACDQARRILYVIPTLRHGGTEGHLLKLCRGLVGRGWQVQVVCWFAPGRLAADFESAGVPVLPLQARALWDPRSTARFFRLVGRLQPRAVHAYMFGLDAFALLPARLAGCRILLSSRRELAAWMRWHHLFLQRIANRLTSTVVACSHMACQYAVGREGLDACKTRVIYNGVDSPTGPLPELRERARGLLGTAEGTPVVGIVANLSPIKAHDVFLQAAALVRETFPSARFIVVGDGRERGRLERLADELGLGSSCRFLGYRADVSELVPGFDIGVLCSHSEGLPNAVLEYMAARVPVVATAVGGIPEVVDPEVGVLVPPGDVKALAKAILSLLDGPQHAAALGAAGRCRVAERFTTDHMVESHVELYQSLIGAE